MSLFTGNDFYVTPVRARVDQPLEGAKGAPDPEGPGSRVIKTKEKYNGFVF